MTGKSIGLSGALYDYYARHAYREPPILAELREETAAARAVTRACRSARSRAPSWGFW